MTPSPRPPDWPRLATPWLDLAIDIGRTSVMNRLRNWLCIAEISDWLAEAGIRRTVSLASRLEAIPGCFLNRGDFSRWFAETAYVAARAALPEDPGMAALLGRLPPEQSRLVAWLYAVPPLTDGSLARNLGPAMSALDARRQAIAAWNAFRAVLTAHFVQDNPRFPPPLVMERWLFPQAQQGEAPGDS